MKKITINMLSKATKVAGQGVGSAYLELIDLLKNNPHFEILINSHQKADIIHAHTINPNYYLKMKFTKSVTVAYVHFLPHTLDGSIKLPKLIFQIFKKYVISFYKNASHLVVVNPIFIEDLVKYGIPREKVTYIPNYVSNENFYPKTSREKANIKEQYGIPKDKFIVIGVGQLQTRKGVLDFIEVAKKIPDVFFVWCGGFSFKKITDGYEEIQKIYKNPPKNVKFLGIIPREEMNDAYNIADLLFMPSYNELFPMAILEAINLKIPLLLRDLDLYKDILFNKYMACNNNKEFIANINKIRQDPKEYQKYQKLSSEINNYYSKENVTKIWNDYYQSLLKDK